MNFDQILELKVGDTLIIQNRTLTLLDTEDGLVLLQLDAEDQNSAQNEELLDEELTWDVLPTELNLATSEIAAF